MSNLHPTFRPGQRVRSVYGESFTVLEQQGPNGSGVLVEDRFGARNHFHPSKLALIKSEKLPHGGDPATLKSPFVARYTDCNGKWVFEDECCLRDCFPDRDDPEYY